MALQFGVIWLCALLWGCSSLSPEKGDKTKGDYYPHERSQTSGLHYSEVPVNRNYENEMQARRQQSYVPPQRRPVPYEPGKVSNPASAGLREERVHTQPNPRYGVSGPSIPSAERNKHSSRFSNPFGVLVKQHTHNLANGVSFPTINQFQNFIEAMKSSYLIPGGDSSRYFQTARETIKNVEGESSMGYNGFPEQRADDVNRNNQDEQGASNQMPDEHLSVPDPIFSAGDSSDGDANPESNRGSLYPQPHVPLMVHGSSDLDYPEKHGDTIANIPENQQFKMPDYVPSRSFYDEELSLKNPEYTSSANPPYSENQDFTPYRSTAPESPVLMTQKYVKDSIRRPQTPTGDYIRGKVFRRVSQNVSPLNLFLEHDDLSSYVPKVQLYIPTQRKMPKLLTHVYFPADGLESKSLALNYLQPSLASSSNNDYGPLGTKGRVTFQTHDQSRSFKPKQPDSSQLNPSSIDQVLSKPDYLEYQRDSPNVLNSDSQAKDEIVDGIASHKTTNSQSSFSSQQRNFSIDGSVSNRLESDEKRLPAHMKKVFKNHAYWPSDLQSAPKGCLIWTDGTKRNDPLSKNTQLSKNPILKNRNRFARATAYLSKTCYAQYQQALKNFNKDPWKVAPLQRKFSKKPNPGMLINNNLFK